MFHSRIYRLFISVVLVALMLPASLVAADTGQSVSPQTDTPPKEVRSCPPYNPELAGKVENVQRLAPECVKMYRENIRASQQMAPQAEALAAGGPDDFGYTFNTAGYGWIAASTNTGLTGDDDYSTLSLPFDFPFYGFNYSQLFFNTNGLISFDQGYTWGGGDNIPYPGVPNNFIAPFWEDLVVGANFGNPAGGIYYQVFGSAPNRYLVLEWRNVDLWNNEASADFSFEAILYENGDIKFQYKSLPSASYYSTAGIEDSLGNDGLQYQYGSSGLAASSAVLFTYPTLSTARVFLSPLSQGSFAVPGGTQAYTVKVGNIGSMGVDTYDLGMSTSWPAALYDSNGVTPLTDTDSDGTIDTGPIAQSSSHNIVVKVSAPGSAQVGDNNSALLVATSSLDVGESVQVGLSTSIPAAFANAFVDEANYAMSFMTASRYQSNNYKLTANNYFGNDFATIRLSNGNYLYAWDKGRQGQHTYVYEIEYMIVGANGSTVRGVTRLASLYSVSNYTSDQDPSLAVAPNGTIGIAWKRYVYNYNNDTQSYNIYFATLDSAGKLLTGPTAITGYGLSSNAAWLNNVTIAATDDNRYLLSWLNEKYTTTWIDNLYIAGRNTAGASVFSPKAFTSNNQSYESVLSSLTGGKAILTWKQNSGGPYYAVLNSSGTTYKTATNLASIMWHSSPDAVLLPNGKTAVAWATESGVEYSILNSSYNIESGPHGAGYGPYGWGLSVTTDAASHVIMSWQDGSTYQTLVYALGDISGNYLTQPMPYKTSSTFIDASENGQGIAPFGNKVDINIGNSLMGRYEIPPKYSLVQSYTAVQNGPVKVKSPEGKTFVPSERVIAGTSFNEVMGYPTSQLTTEYWFPWYDNIDMATWILVGNPTTSTAAVDIYIGGVKQVSTAVSAGGNIKPRFPLKTGPVRVVSTNGVKIFASERTVYGPDSAFNEVMGYPANQFTTEYWFPWYDNVTMATWILVGNPSTTSTAAVDIYIGGVKRSSYVIPKGGNVTPRFALQTGPVRVVATNGVPIFTSERTIAGDSFNEVMGYPNNQLTTDYWFPWYDNVNMATWVLVGNPSSTSAAAVDIYVGPVKRGSYSIPAKGAITQRFALSTGPVRVVVTNGIKVFTSQRVLYGSSFNEVMGYPGDKLTTEYWFPWYDSTSMSTDIVVGMP
jgi:hypothetical protein